MPRVVFVDEGKDRFEVLRQHQAKLKSYPVNLRDLILEANARGIEDPQNIWYQASAYPDRDQRDEHTIQVSWVEHPKRLDGIPVLILDADINRSAIGQIFPSRQVEFHDLHVARRASIVQVSDTPMSTEKLKNDGRDLRRRIEAKATDIQKRLGPGLVIGPKPFIDRFKPPSNVATGHFNLLRGKNEWEHCEWVMVVGRNQPSTQAMEKQARALFAQADESLDLHGNYSKPEALLRSKGGAAVSVKLHSHPDPRIHALLQQCREAEIEQAIDRIRPIRALHPKYVFVLTNVPLADSVDELLTLEVFPGERRLLAALEAGNGVLPLGKKVMAEQFPGRWKSEAAADSWIQNVGLREAEPDLKALAGWGNDIGLVQYRVKGMRGPASRVLTRFADSAQTTWALMNVHDTDIRKLTFLVKPEASKDELPWSLQCVDGSKD